MKAHYQKAWEELKKIYYEHLEEYGVKLPAKEIVKRTAKQIWLAMLYDSYKKKTGSTYQQEPRPNEILWKFRGNLTTIFRGKSQERHKARFSLFRPV